MCESRIPDTLSLDIEKVNIEIEFPLSGLMGV